MWGRRHALLAVAIIAGCHGSTHLRGQGDADDDTAMDSVFDPPLDSTADEAGTDACDAEATDPASDLPFLLVAEGDAARYAAQGSWPVGILPILSELPSFPAAFSGSVYSIPLATIMPSSYDHRRHLGVYRLEPGIDMLGVSWFMDGVDIIEDPETASICWSGEAFIAAIPMPGIGIYLLAIDEAGSLVRPLEIVGTDLAYDPFLLPFGITASVFCPEDGPFLVDPGRGEGGADRLHRLTSDGALDGTFVDVDLPVLEDDMDLQPRCPVVGREVACLVGPGDGDPPRFSVVLLDRDGSTRTITAWSDPSRVPWSDGEPWFFEAYDLVNANDDLALLFGSMDWSTGEERTYYGLISTDDTVVVPVRPIDVAASEPPIYMPVAVCSGEFLLVASTSTGEMNAPIYLHLLDLTGEAVSPPLLVSTMTTEEGGTGYCPRLFWEGDAFAALWTRHRDLFYQRFVVVEE